MQLEQLTVLSLADEPSRFAAKIGESFRRFGFALVSDHGLNQEAVARAWRLTAQFFALPEAEKRRYVVPAGAGQRGYTPFGVEIAKGAERHDLKEFFHVGREGNLWPERLEHFQETFAGLFVEFDRIGAKILSRIALDLGLAADWFDQAIAGGNSILRLLHYPPLAGDPEGALRAGAHEDINLITLLLGAEEAGLELLTRDGEWLAIEPPAGTLVVNIGDMLQRLTNHVLPSTTHRVRNPAGERARHSRYSMPFFLHPRKDFVIETLQGCVSAGNPDRYPAPITADDYLQERLREIGLNAYPPRSS